MGERKLVNREPLGTERITHSRFLPEGSLSNAVLCLAVFMCFLFPCIQPPFKSVKCLMIRTIHIIINERVLVNACCTILLITEAILKCLSKPNVKVIYPSQVLITGKLANER